MSLNNNFSLMKRIGVLSAILVISEGCKKEEEPAKKPDAVVEVKKDNQGKTIEARPTSLTKAPALLSFKEGVLLDPPSDFELQPPDKTYNGKNAIKIYETIANGLWDQITFTNNEGKRIRYRGVLATDLGEIHFDLLGDHAPNHVRSFVCLAKTGYYDGMGFYYSLHRKVEDGTVAYIEAGCPRGTGDPGSGSIGYWLKPEISEKLIHEEGVIGACLGEDPDSASTRFYITAAPNPYMDGKFTIFGRVTKGMDIVRTINKRAVTEFDRLEQPVGIRSVTIQTVVD